MRKGYIIGFRALVTAGREQIEDKTPIHIADIKSMTEQLEHRLDKDDQRDADDHGSRPSGSGENPGTPVLHVPAVGSTDGPPEGRRRTPRVMTNISTLGEIHHLDEKRTSLFEDADCVYMSDDLLLEPTTHAESLRGSERTACVVMVVMKTPPGVKLLKSKYVYKRKGDKVGKSKNTRLALLYWGVVRNQDLISLTPSLQW